MAAACLNQVLELFMTHARLITQGKVGPADDDEIDLDSLLLDTDSDEEENPLDVSGAQVSEARRVPSRTRPRRRVVWARPAPPLTEWPPVPPGGAQKGCGELGRVRLP